MRACLTLAAALSLAAALPAAAGCRIAVGKCVTAGSGLTGGTAGHFSKARVAPPKVAVGETLPEGHHVMINTRRYGLPPVTDGALYFRVERRVYRVDSATREILEDVTHLTNRAF
ncbi:hypothetical protein [Marinovum sp.]|uniref:hypothetical protein n=1 Tax=Marinovum sp. TaxID=2024839 RepID=UPI002B277AD1|nr:hypothetical protein [Marinovum sp.]